MDRRRPIPSLLGLASLGFLVAHPATAAPNDPGDATYPAAFFAGMQSQTALDMVERLPGFTFDEGDEDVRGYAGASGNVLIDGQRPASKYDTLDEVLKRIPASAVERIELIRGGAAGVDMQGQTVVANVIRRRAASIAALAEAGLYAHGDGRLLPGVRLEASRRAGDRLVEGSLRVFQEADDESGRGFERRRDSAGGLVGDALSRFEALDQGVEATVGYERPLAGGKLRLNAALLAQRTTESERVDVVFPRTGRALVGETEDLGQVEFGAHYARTIGSRTEIEALAIQQLRTLDQVEQEDDDGDVARFTEDATSGESIGRVTVRFAWTAALALEWGGEAALNVLDSKTRNTENGVPVPLPAASVRVEERRAEAFGRVTWKLRPDLSLETGGAVEVSQISQSGDSSLVKSLVYAKPRTLLTWSRDPTNQVRLRIEREVGQLDFGDFVSSSEFSTGTVDAGNANLEPFTAWVFEAAWERRFFGDAAAVFTLRHARISDVVDIVPIFADTDGDGVDEVFEGPGNIGSGTQSEAEFGMTLPLRRFGVPGGLLKGALLWRRTAVTDPLTGETRRIAGAKQPWEGEFEFSQDLPARRLKWGVELTLGDKEYEYRLDEVRVQGDRASVGVFLEVFPAAGWSVRAEAQNLTAREVYLVRDRYDGPRDVGRLETIQNRARRFEPFVHLRLRRQLG